MLIASTLVGAAMGAGLESSAIIRELARERAGSLEASVWFDPGPKLPAPDAARVNAVMSNATASDDSAGTAGFQTVLRSFHTAFLDEWSAKREEARRERDRLRGQIVSTTQSGRQHERLLTAGQTAGGIKEVLPVGEIMRRLMAETEAALSRAPDVDDARMGAARM
jgi:hypothetical protein